MHTVPIVVSPAMLSFEPKRVGQGFEMKESILAQETSIYVLFLRQSWKQNFTVKAIFTDTNLNRKHLE